MCFCCFILRIENCFQEQYPNSFFISFYGNLLLSWSMWSSIIEAFLQYCHYDSITGGINIKNRLLLLFSPPLPYCYHLAQAVNNDQRKKSENHKKNNNFLFNHQLPPSKEVKKLVKEVRRIVFSVKYQYSTMSFEKLMSFRVQLNGSAIQQ